MNVTVILTNTERYLSKSFGNIVFIDSFQRIPDKLSKHIANLLPPALFLIMQFQRSYTLWCFQWSALLCYSYVTFRKRVLEVFIIELLTLINPQSLWLPRGDTQKSSKAAATVSPPLFFTVRSNHTYIRYHEPYGNICNPCSSH